MKDNPQTSLRTAFTGLNDVKKSQSKLFTDMMSSLVTQDAAAFLTESWQQQKYT